MIGDVHATVLFVPRAPRSIDREGNLWEIAHDIAVRAAKLEAAESG